MPENAISIPTEESLSTRPRCVFHIFQAFPNFWRRIYNCFLNITLSSTRMLGSRSIDQQKRLEDALKSLDMNPAFLRCLLTTFVEQLQKGIEMHKKNGLVYVPEESDFRMLDSCVSQAASGSKKGLIYAIDFGGSTLRIVRCIMGGNGKIEIDQSVKDLSSNGAYFMGPKTSATELFDEVANNLSNMMEKHGDLDSKDIKKVGMAFSFPAAITDLKSCFLECWAKGFQTGRQTDDPVESKDVVLLLQAAIDRKNIPASVVAVVNDTVGTLLSCAYQKPENAPECRGGVILGTGHNSCYIEPEASKYGYKGSIINVESGNFSHGLTLTLPDLEIDYKSPNTGQHLYEKQISGNFLGELTRLFTIQVFQNRAPPAAWREQSLSSGSAAALATAPCVYAAKDIIKKSWGVELENGDIEDIKKIAYAIFRRSAALASVTFAAIFIRTTSGKRDKDITIGVDGSLYSKNSWYVELLKEYMKEILGEETVKKIHLVLADDGSGKGAALCAHSV